MLAPQAARAVIRIAVTLNMRAAVCAGEILDCSFESHTLVLTQCVRQLPVRHKTLAALWGKTTPCTVPLISRKSKKIILS